MKVLLYDVESSPNLGYCFGKWEQNIIEFAEERQIISVAWRWLGEKEVHVLSLTDFPGYKRDPKNNKALIRRLHALISKADVVVGHNVSGFDDKMVNTDIIKHGFTPPPPHKTIDTLKIARRYFRFNSNKLGDLGEFLKLGKKVKHWGFELWRRCGEGDPKAWALMRRYNAGDVILLEKIYLKFRPWVQNLHPNMNISDGHVGCPTCRGVHFKFRGRNYTKNGWTQRYQCLKKGCGRSVTGRKIRGVLHYF